MNEVTPTKAGFALNRAISLESELWIPAIAVHELWFGVAKSLRKQENANRLTEFLTEPFRIVDFTAEDARIAGEIRAELARRGTPIGPYDVLIASQALVRDLTVVTANTREFSRVDGLKLVDWTR